MKVTTYIALVILGIALILFAFKECEYKPSDLQVKSENSLKSDSIKKRYTDSLIFAKDSIIKAFYKMDSIQSLKSKSLTTERNRLLAIVRVFTGIKIDSVNHTVNNIPIAVYEAEMNANLICDTLLQFKDVQISIRDSIIDNRQEVISSLNELIETKDTALQDIIALDEENENKLKHAKSLNKKIPLIMAIEAGVILLLIAL